MKTKHILILFLCIFFCFENQTQAQTKDKDSLAITQWLVAGPIPFITPAFDTLNNIKGEKFTNTQWLSFPSVNINNIKAELNTHLLWNGNSYPWTTKETQIINGSKGIQLTPASDKNPNCSFLVSYIKSTRFQKVSLNVESRQAFEIYLDGKMVLDKKSIDADSTPMKGNKKEITLEPGFHTLCVKTLLPANTKGTWLFNAWISYTKQAEETLICNTSTTRDIALANYLYGEILSKALLSYDGRYYALTHTKVDKDKLKSESWIEIRNSQNNRLEKVLRGVSSFSFAKHANFYVYRQTKGKETAFYIGDLVNNTEEKIYETEEGVGYTLAWDPQGNYLIFSTSEESEKPKNGLRNFLSLTDRWPYWRTRSLLQKIDIASKVVSPLTHGYLTTSLEDISADGKEILFSVSENCDTIRPFSKQRVYKMALSNNTPELLWEDSFSSSASFSPDGKQVLILGSAAMFDNLGKSSKAEIANDYDIQAYLFDIASKKATPISLDFNPNIFSAQWDASGKSIWFNVEDKDLTKLFIYDIATQKYNEIPLKVENLQSFDIATTQGALIYSGSSASESSRAYLVKANSKKSDWKKEAAQAVLLAQPQKEELKNVSIGEHKDWKFKNAGGVEIEATYYLPPNFDAQKKYPMIVYYYGGTSPTPRSFEMRYPKNVWAANSYVVLVMQPSGATGFGQEFAAEHVNNWGMTVADEIISGTRQFCGEFPFVDSTKLGCIGASYGGFMTQLIITKTSLFSAAISHAGISSISSYWGEGYWGYLYSSAATANSFPWNRPDIYVGQSPLFHADKINTPLLLLHGGSDKNVPVGESLQMFTALRLLGKPVEYVEIEGEDHGIVNPAKRLEWEKTILAWFAKYLKGEPLWWNTLYPQKDL